MSPEMQNLFITANAMKIGSLYTELTRNPSKEIRDKFKKDREIEGSYAWAICKCMSLSNPSVNYSPEECEQILKALSV